VLDLDAGVHLDEDVPPLAVEQELDGARVDVADVPGKGDRMRTHRLSHSGIQARCGRDLDDLLVPALHRAVPLVQVHHAAAASARICTSMCRGDTTAFSKNTVGSPNALSASRMAASSASSSCSARSTRRMPRPPPPATALTNSGIPDPGRSGRERVDVPARRRALEHRQAGGPCGGDGSRLVAGQVQDVGGRADERESGVRAGLRQCRVFAQEPVAGVDGVGVGLERHPDDLVRIEVGAHGVAGRSDLVRLVCLAAVLASPVLEREHSDGLRAELGGGAERPDGDLAAVGD
jgi:hypothetical protein